MNAASQTSTRPAIEMHNAGVNSMRDMDAVVLEGIEWSVASGDFWVVGGLQGTGKSDFLLMTAGLMAPAGGTYYFFGAEMPIFEDERLPERLRLGLVFDGGQIFNHLTISQNVALPLRYHQNLSKAEAATEVQRMLDLTDLGPWADSTPGAVGRNWQKRVGLARALMLRPDILLLDNPLAGLDLRHRAWWLNFLEQLSKGHPWMEGRPVTLVATADDLRPWRKRARQFAYLKNKRLIVVGSWEQVEAMKDEEAQELWE